MIIINRIFVVNLVVREKGWRQKGCVKNYLTKSFTDLKTFMTNRSHAIDSMQLYAGKVQIFGMADFPETTNG